MLLHQLTLQSPVFESLLFSQSCLYQPVYTYKVVSITLGALRLTQMQTQCVKQYSGCLKSPVCAASACATTIQMSECLLASGDWLGMLQGLECGWRELCNPN